MATRYAGVVLGAPLLYRVADDVDEDEFVAAFVLTEFADDAVVVPFALLIARWKAIVGRRPSCSLRSSPSRMNQYFEGSS